jgi:DNA mismatch repair ATPase MutL
MILHVKISEKTQRMLTELQVRLSTGSKRMNQIDTVSTCVEIVHDLPKINSCPKCGKLMAGIGVCSDSCYEAWTGQKYVSK